MKIELRQLKAKNFKGLKDYSLILSGKNASIYGANGTGKTTLYDMFLWLFFGKDSSGRTEFGIKPTDENGEAIHGLEHEVEGVLSINGKPLKLRKTLIEIWRKKHGEADRTFTGHETGYWIDDVPAKKKDYDEKINSTIDEEIFRLLTNPHHFNNDKAYPWKKRRDILMEICGDLTDQEVISTDQKLAKLTDTLNGKSVENYRLIVREQIKKLNTEIEKIPVRIDELNNSLTEDTTDYAAIESEIEQRNQEIAAIETEQTSIANAATVYRQKQQGLRSLENDLKTRKEEIDSTRGALSKKLIDERSKLENRKYALQQEERDVDTRLTLAKNDVETLTTKVADLRAKWQEENAKTYIEPGESFTCPTCGQNLPEETVEQKLSDMRNNFERTKKAELYRINAEGKSGAQTLEGLTQKISDFEDRLKNIDPDLIIIDERITEINAELGREKPAVDYEADAECCGLQGQIKALEADLDKPAEDNSAELIQKKLGIREIVDSLRKILNNKDNAEKTRARIEELKLEERRLAGRITELEGQEFLMDEFFKKKVNLLENSINNQFKSVRFKLFDIQVNGGLEECCRTLINTNGSWVEWQDGNNGGRISAGLSIINVLSEHYGFYAPVFVDNQESVDVLPEMKSQIISLIVPLTFEKLDKEFQDSLIDGYGSRENAKEYWDDRNKKLRVEVA